MKWTSSLSLLLLGIAISLHGAQTLGSLRLTIVDASGAVIPRAHIRLVGSKNFRLVANSHGVATLNDLPAGNYDIIVSRLGFARTTVHSVAVVGGARKELEVRLETGLPNPFVIRDYQTLKPHMYSKLLEAVGQPGFCESPLPPKRQYYRFLWLPTFGDAIFMRVDVLEDGTAVLHAKILQRTNWKSQKDIDRKLSPDEEVTLFTTLADIGFWNLPARVEFKDPFHLILDGTDWVIEGVKDGRCHAVTRYSSPLTELFRTYILGSVANLKSPASQ